MARLTLALLGGFHVAAGRGAGLPITSKKARALLAYLALRPGQLHSRDHVAGLLWGGADEAQARQSLRQTLLSLRRALPSSRPPILLTDGGGIAVSPAIEVDALRFERLGSRARPAALREALVLYRGDLLDGLHLREPLFEQWLRGERERLRGRAADTLERLSTGPVGRRAIDLAVRAGLGLLAADPLQESVHRSLMRLYLASGRTAAALAQYRRCAETLQRELGVQPDAATRDLHRQIMAREGFPAPRPPRKVGKVAPGAAMATPLVGRGPELARLGRALDDARQGGGSLVTVSGEAGIGKTRLIEELAAGARTRGFAVVVGRCFESEQVLSFAPWIGMLRGDEVREALDEVATGEPRHRTELARLLPDLGRAADGPSMSDGTPVRIFDAVARVVEVLAARRPSMLVLEDLHWADEMSVRLLAVLARRSRSWPVLLVASMRDDELLDRPVTRRLLAEVGRGGASTSLRLAPLGEADTLTLVGRLAASRLDRAVAASLGPRVWRLSEGHPFMVVETVRAIEDGATPHAAEELPLAQRIEELIAARLERLATRSQSLAEVAAVIGREFEPELLQRAAGVSAQAAAETVQDLVRRRVLRTAGEHLAFSHDRIREVAYRQLLPPRRRLLHGAVARAMEALYAPDLEPHWAALGAHHAEARSWARSATCLRHAAAVAMARGAFQDSAAHLEGGLAALDHLPTGPDTQEAAIDCRLELWMTLMALGEFDRMLACGAEAERTAAALGDRHRLGWASACLSHTLWIGARQAEACEFAARAQAIGDALGDVLLSVNASFCLGASRVFLGDYEQAEPHLEKAATTLPHDDLRRDRRTGLFPAPVGSRCWLGVLCAERGEFDRGLARVAEAARLAEALDLPSSLSLACWALGYLWAARGRADEALGPLGRSLSLVNTWHLAIMRPLAQTWLGSAYVASGRIAEGLPLVQEGVQRYGSASAGYSHARVLLGQAYLRAGRLEDALSSATEARAIARDQKERGHEAWAFHLLGDIVSQRGPLAEAEDHYRRALVLADALGMRPLLARCHLGLGTLLSRAGQREAAGPLLATAAALFEEMGMPRPPA